ncbi:MAG: cytochrome c1 [Pseudomonadota bacterium]
MKKTSITLSTVAALMVSAGGAFAAGEAPKVTNYNFPHDGPFGSYDQLQLQRGLQVYTEICSACHGLQYVPIRTLADEGGPGLPTEQVRAYAEFYELWDPTLEDGFGDFRTATPNDHFPTSQLEGAPDLSLMAKARAGFSGPYQLGLNQLMNGMGGPEYIASLLAGYADPPSCAPDDFDGSYNTVFTAGGYPEECIDENGEHKYPGSWIGMSQPLWGDDVFYEDDTEATIEQQSVDVAAFLMWTAEPKLNQRKQAGLTSVIMLSVLAVLLYLTNKRLWAPIKGKRDEDA